MTPPRAHRSREPLSKQRTALWWCTVPVLLALACWAGWWIPLNNDVSWQYWVARQMRGGATLYRDIIEVNPPLWFWEAVPLSAIAEWLHVDARHVAIASVMARVMLALLLMARLIDDRPLRQRGALLVGLAFLLCVLPLHDFAEREHLMLIGALPYAALLARRRGAGRPVSTRLAAAVGLFAAYGFAMKPHFAMIPIALEMWLVWGLRRSWRPIRPETVALAVVAALYAVAVPLFAPDYLRLTVPLAIAAYGAFSPPFAAVIEQYWVPSCLLAALALAIAHRALPLQSRAAAITALALAASYVAQGKGFSYQAVPVAAALGWALWLLMAEGGDIVATALRRPLAAVALTLLAGTCALIGPFRTDTAGRATDAVARLPPGSVVGVISAHSWLAFPFVEDRRFAWPMRNIGLWTIPMIARHGEGPAATAQGLTVRRETLDGIAVDLWCHPPDAMMFDDPRHSPALRGLHFSYQAFVRSDPRIRDLLARYRPVLSADDVTVYARTGPIAPRGSGCRTLAIRPDYP